MAFDEVAPNLFVGSAPSPGAQAGFHVLVLAAEEYQPHASRFPGVEVIQAPFDDAPSWAMTAQEVAVAVGAARQVARHLRAGHRVLVTCALGLNRSALIAGLAMHEVYGMHPDDIVVRLRRARGPWALSNPNFESLLRAVVGERESLVTTTRRPTPGGRRA